MIWLFSNNSARFSGNIFPVSSQNLSECTLTVRENVSRCWSIRGLVGARIKTLLSAGDLSKTLAATRTATVVLPKPVGRTTSEFFIEHWSAMSS